MIIEYLVVPQDSVNKYIKDGYQPYSSPVLAQGMIWQAVVKYRATQQRAEA